jgi:UDP-N-acetylglucosamine 2-epimerase (non-hydrolysing)
MNDLLFVSGTRPEIIKLAPLYHAFKAETGVNPVWLHTGQHGDMAAQILACFGISADIALERRGSTLSEFSLGCREQLESVATSRPWSLVIVQGDTESAFLGAMIGFYHRIPVAHIEAGLRTGNLGSPFPEEGLRQMIGRIARFHFPPTAGARDALRAEGIPENQIEVTGNTVVDAQHWIMTHHDLGQGQRAARRRILVTVHRRENWGHDVEEICRAIAALADRHPELEVRFPVHLNPVIQKPVHDILGNLPNVQLSEPLDYLEMQKAIAGAWLLLTDSGGLQEEAPTFGVPVLVLRNETERPEAVEAGCARVIGTGRERIVAEVEALLQDEDAYTRMQRSGNPFGDGQACARIIAALRTAGVIR